VQDRERRDASFGDQLRAFNDFNRRVFQRVHAAALAGKGVAIGFTDKYAVSDFGEPIVALKSYVLSPFVDESQMNSIVKHVLSACRDVEGGLDRAPP
jgi:hypothetical protein